MCNCVLNPGKYAESEVAEIPSGSTTPPKLHKKADVNKKVLVRALVQVKLNKKVYITVRC